MLKPELNLQPLKWPSKVREEFHKLTLVTTSEQDISVNRIFFLLTEKSLKNPTASLIEPPRTDAGEASYLLPCFLGPAISITYCVIFSKPSDETESV